ncbi:MAG: hypothetical protein P0S93_05875 [Candidatus Neptunochlamydia sp.]|nr:hypothetical protein [Candidatus Neptunochlamydia sp.]
MKENSSFSLRCKRLIIILVVLLALFCNRFFAEGPFDALITKQSNYRERFQPQTEKGEISLLPFVADNSEFPLAIDPNLEQEKETKHDFLSRKIPLNLENLPSNSSNPYSFESSLINRDFDHKKTETSITNGEKTKRELLFPTSEKVNKRHFHVDDCYSYFDDCFPVTSSYPLESHVVFNVKLIKDYAPHGKKTFSGKGYFAEGYFKSVKWADVSNITKQKKPVVLLPSLETMGGCFHLNEIQLSLEIPRINSSLFVFKEVSIPCDLPYKSYQQEKIELELSSLDREAFEASSYLYIKPTETAVASTPHYPSREKTSPVPSKYSLPQGPIIATELNHGVMTFTLTPECDLYCSKKGINLPEKAQEFHGSALAIMNPYVYIEPHKNVEEKIHTPKPEKQSPLTFSETVDTLTANPSTDSTNPLNIERQEYDPLAMISRSIEFPHLKTSPSPMEFSLNTKGSSGSPLETNETSSLFLPSTGKTFSPVFDSTLNLEIATETSSETFALSQKPLPFNPTLKHPTLLKHHRKSLPSELDIKGNYIATNERFIEDVIVQNDYQPSVQKGEKSLSERLPSFSVPKLQNSFFALETKNETPIQIQDSEAQFEKFANREATNLNLNELPLPEVKRKEISPKTESRIPSKLVEDIPHIQSMATLIERTDRYSTVKSDSFNPSFEEIQHPLLDPLSPTYYPSQTPGLDIATTPSIREKHLEYIKKRIALLQSSPDGLMLPHIAGKKFLPNKTVMTPKKTFEDPPEADRVICLANRDERFPNTRGIIEGNPVPPRIQSEITFSGGELSPLKTDMIRSQSKTILENYHEETLLSSGYVTLASPELEGSPSDSEKRSLNQSTRFTNAFLTEIPPPSHLETVSYNNEFDTSVYYSKRNDGKGYLFSIKMKPSQNLNFASPNQHYIFVIDRSNNIKKHRFRVFKEGVGRALSYLGEGDSFNIVIADAEMIPFSETPTSWSKTSVSKARGFLMDQNYQGFFINYNAFDLLSNVSNYFAPDKENIVVLITDGHLFRSLQDHKNDFKKLTKENQGKFSIFTATASQRNNLPMLDLLSTFNNGELMYSKTNASFSRQLSVLVKHIESFVAKDIHLNVTSIINETEIEFYPNEKTLPSLYADRPYIVYGCIDELKDFDLILQGRCEEKWINIKQTISFKHAEKATHSIKKGIALQKAYVCYDYFLKNDDPFFLKEAQSILEPLHIPTAVR